MIKIYLKSPKSRRKVIIISGLLLIISATFAVIAWQVSPILFPKTIERFTKNNAPKLTSIVLRDLEFNKFTSLDELQVKTWTEPKVIKPEEEAELFYEVLDISGGPISLDTSIHYSKIHTYAIRDDLGGNTLHLHPSETEKESGVWRTVLTLPSAGTWYVVSQTSKDGKAYQFTISLQVGDYPTTKFSPDFEREKEISKWNIEMLVDSKIININSPIRLTFKVTPKESSEELTLEKNTLDNGHNLILARVGDAFAWNQHGDSSVEEISEAAGIKVERIPTDEEPFAHVITFPKSGIWLIHFEIKSQPVHFFVEVFD